jgi:hypothetical protein
MLSITPPMIYRTQDEHAKYYTTDACVHKDVNLCTIFITGVVYRDSSNRICGGSMGIVTSPEVASPEMTSPEVASPEVASPEMTSPEVVNRK